MKRDTVKGEERRSVIKTSHIVRKGQTEWEEVETLSGTQCADWRPAWSFFMGQMNHCVVSRSLSAPRSLTAPHMYGTDQLTAGRRVCSP